MDKPSILHILSPLPHVSPFDITMAYDAGFAAVIRTRASPWSRFPAWSRM